jgi:hypothetical protein
LRGVEIERADRASQTKAELLFPVKVVFEFSSQKHTFRILIDIKSYGLNGGDEMRCTVLRRPFVAWNELLHRKPVVYIDRYKIGFIKRPFTDFTSYNHDFDVSFEDIRERHSLNPPRITFCDDLPSHIPKHFSHKNYFSNIDDFHFHSMYFSRPFHFDTAQSASLNSDFFQGGYSRSNFDLHFLNSQFSISFVFIGGSFFNLS